MAEIIFDCERMKYENTGLFSYCFQLGRHLKKLVYKTSETLTFFAPGKLKGVFGKKENYLSQNSYRKFWMPPLKGFDIWHCTYQNSQYVPKRNNKIKVVLTIHDLNFLYDEKKSTFKKEKYLRHLQSNIDRSSSIICISEFCKQDVLRNCNTGTKPVHVIYNGTSSLEPPELVNDSYRPKTRFLFSIGNVNPKKNFHALLPLLQKDDDMELLIAGRTDDQDYMDYIKDAAKKLGVEKKLRVLGAISEPEKSWYYQNCYAFTFPSLAEGFGLPVTEAMSIGKPLFLANKTALPEIGQDVAFYFKDFSAGKMRDVFTSGMEKYNNTNMKEDIVKRSSEFCWNKAALQYLEVYRSLY